MPAIKPENKGNLITDIETICRLANEGKSVIYRGGRFPAAFIQCWHANHLYQAIQNKLIYHYKKDITKI